jgi:hypothetical protein
MLECLKTPRGFGESNLEFFRRVIGRTVIDVAMHGNNEAYICMGKPGRLHGCVAFMQILGRNEEFDEIGFDLFPETIGPKWTDCPRRILNQLTPVDVLYSRGTIPWINATNWRQRCLQNAAKRANSLGVQDGVKIRFHTPMTLPDGQQGTEFVRIPDSTNRRNLFQNVETGTKLRIEGWRKKPFVVVEG